MLNKNLKAKLKLIQDFKREKYIGTKNVFNYLKRVDSVDNNLKKIVENINNKSNTEITPQILLGFCDNLDSFLDNMFLRICRGLENYEASEEYFSNEFYKIPFKNYRDLISRPLEDKKIGEISDCFVDMLNSYDSYEGEKNNKLGNHLVEKVLEKFAFDNQIKEEIYNFSDSADWDFIFSNGNTADIEHRIKKTVYFEEITVGDRLQDMKRDMVESNLENRREILCDWIYKTSEENRGDLSYEDLLETISNYYNARSRHHNKLIEKNAPDFLIENSKKLIYEVEYLENALKLDKNFVKRYLSN